MQHCNQSELRERCALLKCLMSKGFDILMPSAKTALKEMSVDLTLPFGSEMSKDEMIKNVSDVMLNDYGDTYNVKLSTLEKERNKRR